MTMENDLSRARYRRGLWIVVLIGCLARAGLFAYALWNPAPFDFPDSHRYVCVARNIAVGRGPVESATTLAGTDPVYPAMLAIGVRLGCASDAAILSFGRAINCLFGLVVVGLIAAIGERLFSRRVGLWAAAWCAIDPILLFFNALVLTELPYIAMLCAAILLLIRFNESGRIGLAVLAGAILGVATLTRSSGLFLPLLLAVWLIAANWRLPTRRTSVGAAIAMLLAVFVVMAPVIYRNYELFGAFVPVRTGSGASLMEALGPWADGAPGMDRIVYPDVAEDANEVERDRVYRAAALAWARSHPRETLALAIRKLARTWSITINAAAFQSGMYALAGWLSVAPIFLLGLVGAWRTRRRIAVLVVLLLPAGYFSLLHMVFVGSVRYRLPAMPLIFLLAAVGLCAMLRSPMPAQSDAKP